MTRVLLHLQHSFEMLLKAGLLATGDTAVFDRKKRMAIGMETCVKRCQQQAGIKLTDEEAGTIRVLDNLRDGEQHWHQVVEEGLLYLHSRAAVTLFDDLLYRIWGLRLAEHIPARVLPISAEPPQGLDLLVDQEFERIAGLLKPGRRATAEAKGRARALLATEALSDPDAVEISESDVNRVVKGIREGKAREQVFPKLNGVASSTAGEGLTVEVRFVKKDGLPVTFTTEAAGDAAAIREVDLEKKFHMGPYDLADKSGINRTRAVGLRRHLGLDEDDDHYSHTFKFGSQSHRRYSNNALTAMREAKKTVDIESVWLAHRTLPSNYKMPQPACDQPGCVDSKSRRS
ncbi:hypothetical protein [Corynebacterium doosanense]|nr:hypothetical protein [Corynebacterium doosanense]